jgi:hypothetical protein
VDTAFVGECRVAHVRLFIPQRQVRQFGYEARGRAEIGQTLATDNGMAELQLEIRNDGDQVCVSAALTISIDAALNVGDSRIDRRNGVGYGQVRIVMAVDAEFAIEARPDLRDDLGQARGDGAAIRVAEAENIGAGNLGGFEGAECERRIGGVTVEEVLGVEDDFPAVLFQIGYGLRNQLDVFLFADTEGALGVKIPGFSEDGDNRSARLDQGADVRIAIDSVPCEPRGSERGETRVFEAEFGRASEELLVARVGAGPAALNVVDPKLVELLRDGDLVVHREGDGFALCTIAKRSVEDGYFHFALWLVARSPVADGECSLRSRVA